ncbi:hypothetical protein [Mycolicibacterium chlorophenolicum]|uniref:Uncharacterized protein n=1 Tax=Mycolicibacterium chlorophenolicum TaxID=37916 RepID=A0A0J6YA64_9MYCO|nr:hypothetical protein [Mycolicibacterium chlorophenolicum]KMO69826.1 hypothetical protein MCHLDSM_05938 [Mycolicibacterium chlorophenolicum]
MQAGGLDAAADCCEVDVVFTDYRPGLPPVEGGFDGGKWDVGAGDGDGVPVVGATAVGNDGDELSGGIGGSVDAGVLEAQLPGHALVGVMNS